MTPLTHCTGRTYAVFGLARSGIATAKALAAGGARVACWDDGVAGREVATAEGLALVDLDQADWSEFSALVLAPGVPLTHPAPHRLVVRARAERVEVIGDTELFFRERARVAPDAPVIAITGTNGKSTTTALTAHLLRSAGREVAMGGNIGVGVPALPPPSRDRVHVLELSSFQIDLTPTLNPTVGVHLNVTPDHLDRHGTLAAYAAIKERLVAGAETAVVSLGDAWTIGAAERRLARGGRTVGVLVHGYPARPARGADDPKIAWLVSRGLSLIEAHGDGRIVAADGTVMADGAPPPALKGAHNAENAAVALAACAAVGVADAGRHRAAFPGLAHRLEWLGRIGRIVLINDSKATNAESTEMALAALDGDIHWIVGGVAKEGGIAPLAPYFGKVARAYLIGASSDAFAATLDGKVAVERCETLERALVATITGAAATSAREPVVLLSPACASYDQYKSFEHRGEHMRAIVTALPGFSVLI